MNNIIKYLGTEVRRLTDDTLGSHVFAKLIRSERYSHSRIHISLSFGRRRHELFGFLTQLVKKIINEVFLHDAYLEKIIERFNRSLTESSRSSNSYGTVIIYDIAVPN